MEQVIVVNPADEAIGVMEKMEAHRKGVLHRAFSVFLFDPRGRMLLQRRAFDKYHSPGLWSNACCSHPRPGESTREGALRRLGEELGIKAELKYKTVFTYRAEFENGLIEHEVDHVFTGVSTAHPVPNPDEVADFRWMTFEELRKELAANEASFTRWFVLAMREIQW